MINDRIKNVLSSSYKIYIEQITHVISLYLLVAVIGGICSYILEKSGSMSSIQNLIFYISSELFLVGLSLGLVKVLILIVKNQPTNMGMLFSSFDLILKSFNASILFSLAIFLMILPGLIIVLMACNIDSLFMAIISSIDLTASPPSLNFGNDFSNIEIYNKPLFILGIAVAIINVIWCAIRLQFYQYFIVDEQQSAFKSLKSSYVLTDNQIDILLQFAILILGINFLGLLCFGIGLIITIPFSLLAMSKLYLSLKQGVL